MHAMGCHTWRCVVHGMVSDTTHNIMVNVSEANLAA